MRRLKITFLSLIACSVLLGSNFAFAQTVQAPKDFAFWHLDAQENIDHYLRIQVAHSENLTGETNLIFTMGKWDQELLSQREHITKNGAYIPVKMAKVSDFILHRFPINATLTLSLVTAEGDLVPTYYGQNYYTFSPRSESSFLCGDCHNMVLNKMKRIMVMISQEAD